MAERFQAPRGTFDVLPPESAARARLYVAAAELLARAGYERIETPVFEDTELFARGVGESTDIVRKEMFTFADQGGRSLTLRPEATAPICRAYVEHGMHTLPQPVKLWWYGAVLPPRAPAGRALSPVQPDRRRGDRLRLAARRRRADRAARRAAARARGPGLELRLGSLGSVEGAGRLPRRAARLPARARVASSRSDVRERIDENPLRAFDSKDEGTRAVMAEAPTMLDRLDGEDAEHFEAVRRAARPGRDRLRARRHARPRARLLHAHGVRVRLRPARRAVAGRPAAGATTA